MATPTTNSVGISNVSTSAAPELIIGQKWGGGLGTGVTLEFSFSNADSAYSPSYGIRPAGNKEFQNPYFLTNAEKDAVRLALLEVSAVVDVTFTEMTDTESNNGDIRFGGTNNNYNNAYAFAYYPWTTPAAGDVWFSAGWNAEDALSPGGYDYFTILHEMGHALGLKHSFESPSLPDTLDNYFFTVMSYRASATSPDEGEDFSNYASFYPTTLMYYDLVALQALYGRNSSHNTGNTTYSYQDGQTYFETIDDVSGKDTIKFSGSQACEIYLSAGSFSAVSEEIGFYDGVNFTYSRSTVCVGPNTLIENATGGQGSDRLEGNAAGNTLTGNGGYDSMFGLNGVDHLLGGGGNDTLNGGGGNDTLIGGAGRDRMIGASGADTFVFNAAPVATAYDTITDFQHNVDKIQLENGVMSALGGSGALAAAKFWKGAAAHDANDRVIYHPATGDLFYDSNGNNAGGSVLLAKLDTGLNLTASDFQII